MNQIEEFGSKYCIVESSNIDNRNKVIRFGPLPTTLGDMWSLGYTLECSFTARELKYSRGAKIHLVNFKDRSRYKIRKINPIDIIRNNTPLSDFVKDGSQLMHCMSSIAKRPEPIEPKDPFDALLEKYPRSRKEKVMIGNQTLEEYIRGM